MSVQSVLLEYAENDIFFASSAILLNNRWVLLPAASFITSLSNKKTIPNNLDTMETSKLFLNNYLNLSTENIKIIQSTSSKNFKFLLAKYVGMFSCRNIKESTDFPLSCGDYNNNDTDFNSLLSLFIIFDVQMQEIFKEKQLYDSINDLVSISSALTLWRGHAICIESSPFAVRELLSSYCQGIICSSAGKNNIFVLTDAPSAPGSEGAPIFAFKNDNKKSTKVPVAMVISSLNWWRGEHTGLTLGVMLAPLLSQLLPKKMGIRDYLFSNKNSVIRTAEKSIVQVFCGNGWGTGVLIDKKLGIFITCSHVVNAGKVDGITLKWKNNQFSGTIIYKTENYPYDIALIQCAVNKIDQMIPIKISIKPAIKGENVLAAGYPIFNSQDFVFPVITKGNIALVDHSILHTTCCILAGSSGGAILKENGELLGIIVCHTIVDTKNELVVFPKINMAIPISAVWKHILEYIKTKDVNVLQILESNDPYTRNKWKLFQSKL